MKVLEALITLEIVDSAIVEVDAKTKEATDEKEVAQGAITEGAFVTQLY